jgi:dTDP-6-deoxy-L-talose 4-dehydrogenase (NAD+)
MTRVLITGAPGFVGRQILRALASCKTGIVPVVRKGKESLVADLPNVEQVISTDDLFSEEENWWADRCQGIDLIIHAAWYAEPGKYLQSPINMDCLMGSLTLAKGAAKAAVKRFVGIGTCFEYDLSHRVLATDTPLKPSTPYAAAKAALFLSLSQWLPPQSITFAWCRLFYLYGEGEDYRRLVPYLRQQLQRGEPAALTTGSQIRDFLDVAEAGKKIADIALGEQTGPVNVCSGTPITVRQMAEQIADEYGRKDLLHFGKRPENFVDPPCIIGIPG